MSEEDLEKNALLALIDASPVGKEDLLCVANNWSTREELCDGILDARSGAVDRDLAACRAFISRTLDTPLDHLVVTGVMQKKAAYQLTLEDRPDLEKLPRGMATMLYRRG